MGRGRGSIVGGGGGPMSRWLSNKGCVLCHLPSAEVVLQMTWGKLLLPPPAQVCGDLSCTGGACGDVDGWEVRAVYCSEDYRLHHKFELFA